MNRNKDLKNTGKNRTAGQFKPGQSGNPAGKPKGVKTRTTKEAKELFMAIMGGEIDFIKDSLEKIRQKDPARYLDVLAKLLPYFIPRQVDIDLSGNGRIITVIPPSKRLLTEID